MLKEKKLRTNKFYIIKNPESDSGFFYVLEYET